jgi:cytoskeletal protein CcmA (bactofilin family)
VRVEGSLTLAGDLDVGGTVEVDHALSAQEINVGGTLAARKATAQTRVSVGGSIATTDGVQGSHVEIGRRGEVNGPIRADEAVINERARVDDVYAQTITLERGASARNLYGAQITVASGCRISGEVQYTDRLEAEPGVTFAKPPEQVDSLPGT